jgi:hypothetical protein
MHRISVIVVLFMLLAAPSGRGQQVDAETFFEVKIRPVLADRCFPCHGGKKVSHGLRVDSVEGLVKGGKSGPALIRGDPDRSLLLRAIRYEHADLKMPPDRPLPREVVADFITWIRQGAPWLTSLTKGFGKAGHWAFEPLQKAEPPPDPDGWAANGIDRFIAAARRQHGLVPVSSADQRTLLRRLSFDLIGLPPTPEDMAAFLVDTSPSAWNHAIERLLASPHYGERWGRHWLDVARYADTAGDNADYPVPEARLYRDYVIAAFNRDKPYDQFIREQIAGDILARQGPRSQYAEGVIATGFLALSRRYATGPYEFWHLTLEDTIDTLGRGILGLTLRCARCHDHKFDPVTRDDYYGLYGFFASTQFPWAGAEEFSSKKTPRQHFVALLSPEQAALRLAGHQQQIQKLDAEIRRLEKESPMAARLPELREQQRRLQLSNLPADLPGAYAVQEGQPVNVAIQIRGEVDKPGPVVQRHVPRFLAGPRSWIIPAGASGRLQLAQWLTNPANPLTARVLVNRIWQHHFGRGLVTTPSNFGARGDPPSHPELLDWLSARFIESGWSIKTLHRLILQSKTYQLASLHDPTNVARDPANRWYWRHNRRRLDAEAIRDALLLVGGHLDCRLAGPHPFPPIESWGWTQHHPFKDVYGTNHRSVYLMTQRFQRHPFLALFDGPDTNTSSEERRTSTVPLQALFLMNNPFVGEQADGFARRLLSFTANPEQRIDLAEQWAWGRPGRADEHQRARHFIEEYERQLAVLGLPAELREREAWTSLARILIESNEFVYLD